MPRTKSAEPRTNQAPQVIIPPEFVQYTVKEGDSFASISRQFYGSPSLSNVLIAANPLMSPQNLKPGRVILMDYMVKVGTGQIVESSSAKGPIEYLHGAGQILPALERALEGLGEGEQAAFSISPEEAYGDALAVDWAQKFLSRAPDKPFASTFARSSIKARTSSSPNGSPRPDA